MLLFQYQVDNLDLKQELKSVTTQLSETEKILEEIQTEDAQLRSKLATVQKELSNSRNWRVENEPKLLSLEKENRNNTGKPIFYMSIYPKTVYQL